MLNSCLTKFSSQNSSGILCQLSSGYCGNTTNPFPCDGIWILTPKVKCLSHTTNLYLTDCSRSLEIQAASQYLVTSASLEGQKVFCFCINNRSKNIPSNRQWQASHFLLFEEEVHTSIRKPVSKLSLLHFPSCILKRLKDLTAAALLQKPGSGRRGQLCRRSTV